MASSYSERPNKFHIFKERSITLEGRLFCLKRNGVLRSWLGDFWHLSGEEFARKYDPPGQRSDSSLFIVVKMILST